MPSRALKLSELGWFLSFLLVLLAAPRLFAEVTAETRPRLVTVFPDSARVTRVGSLELPAGPNQVVFPDLPASVVESSLRLTVEGPQGTKLYGVSLKNDYTPEVAQERTRLLRDKIQVLEDERTDLQDQMEAHKTEIDILKGLAKESTCTAVNQGATHSGTILDFTRSAVAVGKRIETLTAASRKAERRIRDLDAQVLALQREMNESGNGTREKRTAEAQMELPQGGTARFTLTYQVSGASWTPLYDLRLTTEGEKPSLDLAFNAGIRQTTGEDWTAVSLVLSTARPTEGTQVPDPTDWWLDIYSETTKYLKKSMSFTDSANAPKAAAPEVNGGTGRDFNLYGKEEDVAEAQVVTAQTIQSTYAMSFSVPVRRDIPSDGTEHRVGIAQNSDTVALTLVVVPRLSQATYLQAHITYGGEQALLPGQAQLFRDGDFVGTTDLKAKAPGEAFDLGFGQDDSIQVERKLVDERSGNSGFFSSDGERKYRWVTTLTNYHKGIRTVEVREQLPRSKQKDIKVETVEVLPKPQVEDKDKPGLLCWTLDLKPKEKTKVTFGYKVQFPQDGQVSGLE